MYRSPFLSLIIGQTVVSPNLVMKVHPIPSRHVVLVSNGLATASTQLYKGFPWFTGWYWPIRFDFTTVTVPYGDSGQSGLALQLFPLETIVTSNLIGQNKRIVQWKCFIQLGAGGLTGPDYFYRGKASETRDSRAGSGPWGKARTGSDPGSGPPSLPSNTAQMTQSTRAPRPQEQTPRITDMEDTGEYNHQP